MDEILWCYHANESSSGALPLFMANYTTAFAAFQNLEILGVQGVDHCIT